MIFAGARTVTERCSSGWMDRFMREATCSASAIRVKSATVSASPRSRGAMPAAASAASADSAEPASPRRAPRRPLRRWANAASTTAKTCSRVAVVTGGGRRSQATSPESTLGSGQNT